ncbi:MAG: aminotransferase class I/II-fold pyridoxal phosphate-dependent enzyme [bacterium]
MTSPILSAHFANRQPSSIRVAQLKYFEREDDVDAVNVAIGNVSLPMHPAMTRRLHALAAPESPFCGGVVRYTATAGLDETKQAFLNILASSGYVTDGLQVQITDGGSLGMELVIVGCCGRAGSTEKPLLLIDAAYTNYKAFANRLGRATVSFCRDLQDDGKFTLPASEEIEAVIAEHQPGAMVVIPYDNPTGHYYDRESLIALARLCVKHNLWLISDEAYREMFYLGGPASSIWGLTEQDVPGITGRRISIETASKIWNACGLRIGAIVTDSPEFHTRSVAEYTANLCANIVGQFVFGSLAHESHEDLQQWYSQQRRYYHGMLASFTGEMRERMPGVVVSSPDAAIYSVIDVRKVVAPGFDALDFVLYCAAEGNVEVDGEQYTLLTAPMAGFYSVGTDKENPGRTQMRVAYVETPERMRMVPRLFAELLTRYEARRATPTGGCQAD